jgi:hypothetical protein
LAFLTNGRRVTFKLQFYAASSNWNDDQKLLILGTNPKTESFSYLEQIAVTKKLKTFLFLILIELIRRDTLCLTGKWPPRDLEASLFQATTVKGFRFRNPSLLGRSDLLPRPAPHLEVSTGENEVLVPE